MRGERFKAVADAIAASIRAGDLPAGSRLPTHRELARERRIALATATKVYRELAAAGLVVGEPGRGTYVRDLSGFAGLEPRRLPPEHRVADLSFNQPLAVDQGDHLRRALRRLAAEGDLAALLTQQPPGGRHADRAAVAVHLLDRGIDVPPANVLLTAGAQHGLDAVLAAIAPPGAVVAADALTYPGMNMLARTRHVELAPVRCDTTGTDPHDLERLCRRRPVVAVYLIPTLHNPLGFVLDADARQRVVGLARRHDFAIVEDATYAFLAPEAPPPLQTLAPERTFYVGSFSKNLATGLRVGYVVVPEAHLGSVTRALRTGSWGTSGITSAIAVGWLRDGTVTRLEAARRDDARRRQSVARQELAGLDYHAPSQAYSGWLRLPEDARADLAAHRLAEQGILVSTADAFATTPHTPSALRIALATPALDQLTHALGRVRETVTRL
ncbi:aminotransferase-like domain-containing protein [Jiangella rhizosphaerae]|uniref:PLP-dependent aminotransferase family protein n=1 Tax=Jiangella rhizosphaerae TaxID=2293569 RepID=A0A418KNI8_9ACTN|nr:PLP-dependent aminotransferase family protein [Jiangella rhizosphaerae]RIQ20587.1 PLP-dependent aminotransferase family protein [Jiangella rhizosphaerae]